MRKTFKNVSEEHNNGIYSTINDNGKVIRSYFNNNDNNSSNQHEQQNQKQPSDTSYITENTNEEKTVEKFLYQIPLEEIQVHM